MEDQGSDPLTKKSFSTWVYYKIIAAPSLCNGPSQGLCPLGTSCMGLRRLSALRPHAAPHVASGCPNPPHHAHRDPQAVQKLFVLLQAHSHSPQITVSHENPCKGGNLNCKPTFPNIRKKIYKSKSGASLLVAG